MAKTSNLFLQISANSDGLTRAAKAARMTLAELGADAGALQKTMADKFRDMGGSEIQQSTRQLETAYRRTFANIRAAAEDTLSKPVTAATVVSGNIAGAEAQLASARATATAYEEMADGMTQLAQASGGATAKQREFIAACVGGALVARENAEGIDEQLVTLRALAAQLGITADAETEVTASHGRMGASGMIAEHVVRAFSDSVAAGLSPVRAATMEMGRITEAMVLYAAQTGQTEGIMGKFAGFMAGPWGIAFSIGVAVLTPLIEKLFEAGSEADKTAEELAKAAAAADSFGSAESELGKIIDLTTGKLKTQNQTLIQSIKLQAQQAILKAKAAETSDTDGLRGTGKPSLAEKVGFAMSGMGNPYGGDIAAGERMLSAQRSNQAGLAPLQGVIETYVNSKPPERGKPDTAVKVAIDGIDGLEKAGQLAGRDPIKVKQALLALAIDRNDQRAQQDVVDAIDGKGIAPELKPYERPKKAPKPKVDHTAERDANRDRTYQSQVDSAQEAYARAQLALSDTAEQRYKVEVASLQDHLKQRLVEIDDMVAAKKIPGQTQKEIQANADVLRNLATKTEQLGEEKHKRDKLAALLDKQISAANDNLKSKIDVIQSRQGLTVGRQAQYADAQQVLDYQQQQQGNTIAQRIWNAQSNPDDAASAVREYQSMPQIWANQQAALQKQYQSPMAGYKQQLQENVGDTGDALQGVAVDGLKNVENGLEGILSRTTSVSAAFKNMSTSIIADLARIGIEKAIISALGGSFFGIKLADGGKVEGHATGLLPGFAAGSSRSSAGMISGPGTGRSDSILAILGGKKPIAVSNGESIVTARATRQYWPVIKAMNDNRPLPAFANGMVPQMATLSSSDVRQLNRRDDRPIQISVQEGALFRPVVHGIAGQHAEVAQTNATNDGAHLAGEKLAWARGRKLGGTR